jgi:hypothetical protein
VFGLREKKIKGRKTQKLMNKFALKLLSPNSSIDLCIFLSSLFLSLKLNTQKV